MTVPCFDNYWQNGYISMPLKQSHCSNVPRASITCTSVEIKGQFPTDLGEPFGPYYVGKFDGIGLFCMKTLGSSAKSGFQ